MRAMSVKRRKEQPARREVVRQALERDGSRCTFPAVWVAYPTMPGDEVISMRGLRALPERCSQRLDPHEVIPRSAWAKGYLVLDNVRTVCSAHHDWIGDHPDDAHILGLHGYSHERPDALVKSQVADTETESDAA